MCYKVYCENCREDVGYTLQEVETEKEYNGKKCKYIKKVALCNKCQSEVYIPEIFDYNVKAFNDAYKRR